MGGFSIYLVSEGAVRLPVYVDIQKRNKLHLQHGESLRTRLIFYLSTCHNVHIIALKRIFIMPELIINTYVSLVYELKRNWNGTDE